MRLNVLNVCMTSGLGVFTLEAPGAREQWHPTAWFHPVICHSVSGACTIFSSRKILKTQSNIRGQLLTAIPLYYMNLPEGYLILRSFLVSLIYYELKRSFQVNRIIFPSSNWSCLELVHTACVFGESMFGNHCLVLSGLYVAPLGCMF